MAARWLTLLVSLAHTEAAYIAVAVAINATVYYVSDDAPSVLHIGDYIAVPIYTNIRGLSLTPDCSALFVSLSTNVVLRLAGLSSNTWSLSSQPEHTSAVAAGRAGICPLSRDGPARYARFTSIGNVHASVDALTIVDAGSVRILSWTSRWVTTLPNVTDASTTATLGAWILVIHKTGALTAVMPLKTQTIAAAGVIDADMLVDSLGESVVYYIIADSLFRRVLTDATADRLSLRLKGSTKVGFLYYNSGPLKLWFANFPSQTIDAQSLIGCTCVNNDYTVVAKADGGWVCVIPPPGTPLGFQLDSVAHSSIRLCGLPKNRQNKALIRLGDQALGHFERNVVHLR